MSRRSRITARLAPVLLAACGTVPPGQAARPPNIVLLFVDDLGWMDLGCQGNSRVHTPNIDGLARAGMRFTDAYAAAPVCSPTRAALMTGLSPARLGITNHIPDQKRFIPDGAPLTPAKCDSFLPLQRVTIAERLRERGYRTAFLGKWHLCGDWTARDGGKGDPRFHPEHQGFDVNIGGCARGGPSTFFDPYNIHALPDRKKGEYLPYRLTDEAIAWIDRVHRDGPFFLDLSYYTVHWPMEAPEDLLAAYEGKKGPGLKDTRYGAMIEALDRSVGRLLAHLQELGIAENTLVVFTSDNGGYSGVADNRPLREGKGYLYEGGIRVPLIVRWPGVVTPGAVSSEPVITMDLHATFAAAGGCAPREDLPIEGVDLRPVLAGGALAPRKLFFHYPNYAFHKGNKLGGAVRAGRHKLILRYADDSRELYDLEADISEAENLAGSEPELAAALERDLRTWLAATGARMPSRR